MVFVNEYKKTRGGVVESRAFRLAVRGTGEREPDVGDILLAQPARQV